MTYLRFNKINYGSSRSTWEITTYIEESFVKYSEDVGSGGNHYNF